MTAEPVSITPIELLSGGRRPISADSHVTEPPDTYGPRIDAKYRDDAPRMIQDERGDVFHIPGMKVPVPKKVLAPISGCPGSNPPTR